MNAKDPVKIYTTLLKHMPSIGLLSRKKRVKAYIKVVNMTQDMIDNDEIDSDEALFILSIMTKKSHCFRKAGMMTALNLNVIPAGQIKAIGFQYANEMRQNLSLPAVDHANSDPQ